MIKVYILNKFRIFYRNLSQIGLVRGVFLIYIIFLAGVYVQDVAQKLFVIPALYFVLIYLYHTYRSDHQFLRSLYHSPKRLLATEYAILSMPFMAISILQTHFWELALYPFALVFTIQLARFKSIRLQLAPPLAVLAKGSLEYIIGIRSNLLWMLLAYLLAFISVYVQHASLFFAAFALGCIVVAAFCAMHKHLLYLLHYRSLSSFLLINAWHTFFNTSLLLLPMILAAGFMLSPLSFTLRIYASALLLCYTLNISAYSFTHNALLHKMVVSALLLFFLMGFESIYFAATFMILSLVLIYVSSKTIYKYLLNIRYDKDK